MVSLLTSLSLSFPLYSPFILVPSLSQSRHLCPDLCWLLSAFNPHPLTFPNGGALCLAETRFSYSPTVSSVVRSDFKGARCHDRASTAQHREGRSAETANQSETAANGWCRRADKVTSSNGQRSVRLRAKKSTNTTHASELSPLPASSCNYLR